MSNSIDSSINSSMIKCKSMFIITFLLHNLQLLWWNYIITCIFVHYWKLSNYSSTSLNEKKKKRKRNAINDSYN